MRWPAQEFPKYARASERAMVKVSRAVKHVNRVTPHNRHIAVHLVVVAQADNIRHPDRHQKTF